MDPRNRKYPKSLACFTVFGGVVQADFSTGAQFGRVNHARVEGTGVYVQTNGAFLEFLRMTFILILVVFDFIALENGRLGIAMLRTPVGDKYVLEEMLREELHQ